MFSKTREVLEELSKLLLCSKCSTLPKRGLWLLLGDHASKLPCTHKYCEDCIKALKSCNVCASESEDFLPTAKHQTPQSQMDAYSTNLLNELQHFQQYLDEEGPSRVNQEGNSESDSGIAKDAPRVEDELKRASQNSESENYVFDMSLPSAAAENNVFDVSNLPGSSKEMGHDKTLNQEEIPEHAAPTKNIVSDRGCMASTISKKISQNCKNQEVIDDCDWSNPIPRPVVVELEPSKKNKFVITATKRQQTVNPKSPSKPTTPTKSGWRSVKPKKPKPAFLQTYFQKIPNVLVANLPPFTKSASTSFTRKSIKTSHCDDSNPITKYFSSEQEKVEKRKSLKKLPILPEPVVESIEIDDIIMDDPSTVLNSPPGSPSLLPSLSDFKLSIPSIKNTKSCEATSRVQLEELNENQSGFMDEQMTIHNEQDNVLPARQLSFEQELVFTPTIPTSPIPIPEKLKPVRIRSFWSPKSQESCISISSPKAPRLGIGLGEMTLDLINNFDRIPNRSPSPEFAYKPERAIRKKGDRAKLEGWDCDMCRQYYEAIASQLTAEEMKKLKNKCSRHRSKYPINIVNTPPDYWDADFPTTQDCINRGYMGVGARSPKSSTRNEIPKCSSRKLNL